MNILGIYYGHNATVCLLKDGKLVAAASEERFNGIKNYSGFPSKAIDYVLKEGKIKGKDVDLVTVPRNFGTPIHSMVEVKRGNYLKFLIILSLGIGYVRKLWGNIVLRFPELMPIGRFFYLFSAYTVGWYTNNKELDFLTRYLGISRKKGRSFDHHLSHAASAYFASPFNNIKALVLTLDGEGDSFSASVNIFDKDKVRTISRTKRESSLGLLYAGLTVFMGMKPSEHEYKIMGLAPYAKGSDIQKVYDSINKLITVNKDKLIFESKFNTVDTEKFLHEKIQRVRFDVLAAVFQKLTEEKIVEWIRACIKTTGIHTLVLAGGVFMNVKANQRILKLAEVKELFIIPSSGDESSIIGSSYLGFIDLYKKKTSDYPYIPPIKDIYLGPDITNEEIEKCLKMGDVYKKYNVKRIKDVGKTIAKLLAEGNIVARACGRMEFGARALGNRSILADPRNIETIKEINDLIKGRDFWMPFAPSILDYRLKDYVKNSGKYEANYMMMAYDTTDKAKSDLKASMHQADYTVRPHVVRKDFNQKYYNLIKEFEKLTGVGGILNTSFNLHGYPIVLGAKEALFVFKNSGLKYLALNDFLISKK